MSLAPDRAALIDQYIALLLHWNQRINLTAITDPKDVRIKHVEDCLALLPFIESARTLVDLGSGAGLPGLLLAIARPDLEVWLVEATRKKASFLLQVAAALQLDRVRVVCGRAEDPNTQAHVPPADVAVSRATWNVSDLLRAAHHYYKDSAQQGRLIAMKGPLWEQEWETAQPVAQRLRIQLEEKAAHQLSNGDSRYFVVFSKNDNSII